mmetsp:Transcript_11722/g.29624  ORF Transcript_11722/g.29624 Transcript_11722/m.29624 type:complete len:317 (-) Transcript_11722:557-1507(-)
MVLFMMRNDLVDHLAPGAGRTGAARLLLGCLPQCGGLEKADQDRGVAQHRMHRQTAQKAEHSHALLGDHLGRGGCQKGRVRTCQRRNHHALSAVLGAQRLSQRDHLLEVAAHGPAGLAGAHVFRQCALHLQHKVQRSTHATHASLLEIGLYDVDHQILWCTGWRGGHVKARERSWREGTRLHVHRRGRTCTPVLDDLLPVFQLIRAFLARQEGSKAVGLLGGGGNAKCLTTVHEGNRRRGLTEHKRTTHRAVSSAVLLVGIVQNAGGFDLDETNLPHLAHQPQLEHLGGTSVARKAYQLYRCCTAPEAGHMSAVQG